MFKMIGAMVVYGFALYGMVESADWLTKQLDDKSKARSPVDDIAEQIREVIKKHGKGAPGAPGGS